MNLRTIVDAGPFVAFLRENDSHHGWAAEQFGHVSRPLFSCEPVLTEACYLLASEGRSARPLLDLVVRGILKLEFSVSAEVDSIRRLMDRYRDIGTSLADACLVRMSEIHPRCQVMTIDRDFLIYRREGRRTIPLIAPFTG